MISTFLKLIPAKAPKLWRVPRIPPPRRRNIAPSNEIQALPNCRQREAFYALREMDRFETAAAMGCSGVSKRTARAQSRPQ